MNLETSKARDRLIEYCIGNGVDLGFGGDAIIETAIKIDCIDQFGINLMGDASNLYWFKDGVLDYVYASHLLEDFENTHGVLQEWFRVLKPEGYLVIFGPDEKIYKRHCQEKGQSYNISHKIENFSLTYLKEILEIYFYGQYEIVHSVPLIDEYSFDLVVKKL